MPWRSALALAAACALALAGCRQEAPAAAEPKAPVEARAAVDRAVATTGDLITYTLTVDHDPGLAVEIPEAGAEIAGFRIVDVGREEPKRVAGRIVEQRWYRLRADLVGSYVLPPVAVAYRPAGGEAAGGEAGAGDGEADTAVGGGAESGTVETSEIFVEVESVLPADGETTDIRDLKPLRRIATAPPWALIGGAAAALAAFAAAGWWLRRRRARRPAPPPAPPHEVAFAALDGLRATDFADPEAVRRYYFRLSEVVRAYVEGRFGLNATDLTTEEIVLSLTGLAALAPPHRDDLARFLADTDRVKFAAHAPSRQEIGEAYERALSFVEATRPAEPAEEEKAA